MTTPQNDMTDEQIAEAVWYAVTSGAETYRVSDIKHPMTLGITKALTAKSFIIADLEAEVERLKSDYESDKLLWEECHQRHLEGMEKIQELTALCMAQAEALKKAHKACHGCGEMKNMEQALSSPPSQKLLRRMEVYRESLNVLKFYTRGNHDNGEKAKEILTLAKEEEMI